MTERYRIFGSELSPYSLKVRAFFRFKQVEHEWVLRKLDRMEEFQRYARLPLVPLVVTPDDRGLQDSTPIMEAIEEDNHSPSAQPYEEVSGFISFLLEEYGDEWGNKPMFHYRWIADVDAESAAKRIALDQLPFGADAAMVEGTTQMLRERMRSRLPMVGSCPENAATIEGSFARQLELLEAHLETRRYLFGEQPCFGDFGIASQLYQASTDPTAGALMKARSPRVLAWCERMLDPAVEGGFEPWRALAPTLEPFLRAEVAGLFLPWSDANAQALAAGEARVEVELEGKPYAQDVQKYHARSLAKLRARYADLSGEVRGGLDPILERTGCLGFLRG